MHLDQQLSHSIAAEDYLADHVDLGQTINPQPAVFGGSKGFCGTGGGGGGP